MSNLDDYIFRTINQPDATIDPTSSRNRLKNHVKTVSFLSMHVEDSELPCLTRVVDASVTWNKLLACHEKQGPITQVRLIQEALSISYSDDVSSWPTATDHLCELCSRIYSQLIPNGDVMFLVTMLNPLEQKANYIRSEMTSYFLSNPTATSAILANASIKKSYTKSKWNHLPKLPSPPNTNVPN
jgi:hypothetical protein